MRSNNGFLKAFWIGMFLVCAILGFTPNPQGGNKVLMILLSAVFFLPPAILVWLGIRHRDRKTLRLVRNVSILSLSVTLVTLVANMFSVLGSELLGDILYYILKLIRSHMGTDGVNDILGSTC